MRRTRVPELMDAPDADPAELRRSLGFIQRVNRRLRYTRATISHLERFSHGWQAGERITILDVATGAGDIPREMLVWANARKLDLSITGLDRHRETLAIAREAASDGRLSFVQGDALALPFAAGQFDYAITSMFLHHLDEPEVVRVLRELNRVARRGIIVADLLRTRRALAWISLFTVFSNPMVKHDARASVRAAYTRDEIERLRDAAGVSYAKYHRHFGHRFVLAGEKPR